MVHTSEVNMQHTGFYCHSNVGHLSSFKMTVLIWLFCWRSEHHKIIHHTKWL